MAVEVGKETITKGRDGRVRISVQWLVDTRAEAINEIPSSYEGLGFAGTQAQPLTKKNGKYVVNASYEGLTDGAASGDPAFDQYEIIGEDREVKIEQFPSWGLLMDEFGAFIEDGKLKFPETLPKKSKIGSGLGSVFDSEETEDNPMFGVTTYPEEYELARWSMIRRSVPRSIEKMARTVVNKLPAGFDYRGEAESWYVRPLQRRKVGSVWSITVEFQEIDPFYAIRTLKVLMKKVRNKSVLDTYFR